MRLYNYILERWDWWIYAKAVNSVRRMCEKNQGFGYLFLLQIQDWVKSNPIPEDLKRSTESFYESLKDIKSKNVIK